jgi:hypothetical protein
MTAGEKAGVLAVLGAFQGSYWRTDWNQKQKIFY